MRKNSSVPGMYAIKTTKNIQQNAILRLLVFVGLQDT